MQIILIRHAKVLLESTNKITASQMNAWVEAYNHADIDTTPPGKEVIHQIQSADIVLASTLSRSADSLALIGIEPREKNSLFDEIDLPKSKGTWLKLSAKTWLLLLRLVMLLGFGKKSKVYIEAKQRAKKAATYLVEVAEKNKSVVLMGHGGMNWLLGKELERMGFVLFDKKGGSQNWGYTHYISP